MEEPFAACKGDSDKCSNSLGWTSLSYSLNDHKSKYYLKLKHDHEGCNFRNIEHSYEMDE